MTPTCLKLIFCLFLKKTLPLTVTTENTFKTHYLGANHRKALVAKLDNLRLMPELHGRKRADSHKLFSDLNTNAMARKCLHTQI